MGGIIYFSALDLKCPPLNLRPAQSLRLAGVAIAKSGPQIKGGGPQVKCGEINYSPQKIPPLKWPRNKEKRI